MITKRSRAKSALLISLISVLLDTPDASGVSAELKNEVAFYITTYGQVSPERDPQVAVAHLVFERVRAVADKNSKRSPKLVVVNSKADPWAIALPAGHIVLSKQAVAVCHQQAGPEEAETRLAFVLGHELAHLARDDFWHRDVHDELAANPNTAEIARFLNSDIQHKNVEIAADDTGFIYAAMAGYPVDRLLDESSSKPHFFDHWMQQTNTRGDLSHPNTNARAGLLRERLKKLQSKLSLFDFGVRLSHFDYCDDAVYFLQEFQKVFPGREVLNNIGYCYLQMARQEMDAERAYLYWMPLILDGETRAAALGARGGPSLKSLKQAATGKAEGFLRESIQYLTQGTLADPGYLPSRLNLAVAHLYLGKPHKARAVLAEARELAPEDMRMKSLDALAIYEQSDAGLDLWPNAVKELEKLVDRADPQPEAIFNLARLLDTRPRPGAAHEHWNRLAEVSDQLPDPIRVIVCGKQTALPSGSCGEPSSKPTQPLPWRWPISPIGFPQLSEKSAKRTLAGWRSTPFDWFKEKLHGHIYQHPDGQAALLELDGFVQMQVLRNQNFGHVSKLADYCGRRLRKRTLAQGTVWSCDDWAALTKNDAVHEIWWVAK